MKRISRRELLAGMLATPVAPAILKAQSRPTAPVAIARCSSYSEDQAALLSGLFDQIGGIGRLVKNKTVTVKLNLTGSPGLRFRGLPLGVTHYTHPNQIGALAQ